MEGLGLRSISSSRSKSSANAGAGRNESGNEDGNGNGNALAKSNRVTDITAGLPAEEAALIRALHGQVVRLGTELHDRDAQLVAVRARLEGVRRSVGDLRRSAALLPADRFEVREQDGGEVGEASLLSESRFMQTQTSA